MKDEINKAQNRQAWPAVGQCSDAQTNEQMHRKGVTCCRFSHCQNGVGTLMNCWENLMVSACDGCYVVCCLSETD